ncbi:MAG: hypothetical protein J5517_08010 [Eubacterium sp.]|nr:hypothetical protein [Eubacterium sp.]
MEKTNDIKTEKTFGARMGEAGFSIIYLVYAIILAIIMKKKYDAGVPDSSPMVVIPSNLEAYRYGFGFLLAALLVGGDAFHLIPRIIVNLKGSMPKQDFFLGLGNLISSITMTVFYNLLIALGDTLEFHGCEYNFLIERLILLLTIIRILIIILPWNKWYTNEPNRKWAVIRNVPFAMIGVLTVVGFLKVISYALNYPVSFYVIILITVILSFMFYLPVAIFGKEKPKLGMLMIPKTICYMIMLSVICFY